MKLIGWCRRRIEAARVWLLMTACMAVSLAVATAPNASCGAAGFTGGFGGHGPTATGSGGFGGSAGPGGLGGAPDGGDCGAPEGGQCESDLDCCAGSCVAGVCMDCLADGKECSLGSVPCCLQDCIAGFCGGAATCTNDQGACKTDSDCCDGSTCDNDTCGARKTCPGEAVTLGMGPKAVFMGTTGGVSKYASYCSGLSPVAGPENVFSVKVEQGGTLSGTIQQSSFDAVLYVEGNANDGGCGHEAYTLACPNDAGGFTLPVNAGDDLAVFVTGVDGGAGSYGLALDLAPASCGDGVVNQNTCPPCDAGPGTRCPPLGALDAGCEQCDYGATPELGCNATTCSFVPPPDDPTWASNACNTTLQLSNPLVSGKTYTLPPGTTVGYLDKNQAPCGALSGAPDRVFKVAIPSPGMLQVTATPNDFDLVLSIYQGCDISNGTVDGLLMCSDQGGVGVGESFTVPVDQPWYYVVVDGYDSKSYGEYTLSLSLQ